MKKPAGLVNQKIEIYSDQDIRNESFGVVPNSSLYWSTSAAVTRMGAPRNVAQSVELLTPTFRFDVNDRIDKNVQANMLLKYRGEWFTIVSAEPDYTYRDTLVITATGMKLPERSIPNPPATFKIYYGTYNDISEVTQALILSWEFVEVGEGEEILIPFNNPNYVFNGIGTVAEYPELNHYEDPTNPPIEAMFADGNLFTPKTTIEDMSFYPGGYAGPITTPLIINTI
jgi:head-tail adaptor